ncbi:M24 family metallopeptidase [Virgibacillus sp. FSP13]
MYKARRKKLVEKMDEFGVDAIFLSSRVNCYYYSGFTGSSGSIIVGPNYSTFYTDFRYGDQAHAEVDIHDIQVVKPPLLNAIINKLSNIEVQKVGIEFSSLNVDDYMLLTNSLPKTEFVNIDGLILEERMIKDKTEISYIKQGMDIVDKTFTHILSYIKTGITESELALELEYVMKKLGADGIKENHVIATGERSCLPHGQATSRVIKNGDFVKMDFGAKVKGYYTDFTRTVIMGEPTEKQRKIYETVKYAQEISLSAIKAGETCSNIDDIGRSIIREAGYGENFGHSLGHALGLEIHEKPAMRSTDKTVLKPGMVLTVEPGIYIPNYGGVRIEDLIVVEENGINNLTNSTKTLQIL